MSASDYPSPYSLEADDLEKLLDKDALIAGTNVVPIPQERLRRIVHLLDRAHREASERANQGHPS